jgi:hypothetical protein
MIIYDGKYININTYGRIHKEYLFIEILFILKHILI